MTKPAAKQVDADTWSYDLGQNWTAFFQRDGSMVLSGEFPEDHIALNRDQVAKLRSIVNGEFSQ